MKLRLLDQDEAVPAYAFQLGLTLPAGNEAVTSDAVIPTWGNFLQWDFADTLSFLLFLHYRRGREYPL